MGESGFRKGEVQCGCGNTFDTVGELITHASNDHGVDVK